MLNLIAICDLEKSKINLHYLLEELSIDKLTLFEEAYTEILDNFKIIMFILDSSNIGSKFFIDKIKDILEERKNTKSIHFVIDGIERLSKREILRLNLELEKSLEGIIDNPKISIFSSTLASINKRYKINSIDIMDIRKIKSIMLEDEDGFPISSSEITEEHISKFRKQSNIDNISKHIKSDIDGLKDVDFRKKHCSVIGIEGSGKTSVINLLDKIYSGIEFFEYKDKEDVNSNVTDVVLIVLSNIHKQNKEFLNEIKYELNHCKVVVLSNKTDEYMYEEDIDTFKMTVKKYVKDILNTDVIFISAYYSQKWIELEEGNITVEDIRNDKNIVVYDKHNMPTVKFNSDNDFIKAFENQNYLRGLGIIEEILCLSHLKKKKV